jgi:energy-coupling factor transporter transmembrane protein EcfT
MWNTLRIFPNTCMCVYTHIYIYIHTHTHTCISYIKQWLKTVNKDCWIMRLGVTVIVSYFFHCFKMSTIPHISVQMCILCNLFHNFVPILHGWHDFWFFFFFFSGLQKLIIIVDIYFPIPEHPSGCLSKGEQHACCCHISPESQKYIINHSQKTCVMLFFNRMVYSI